MDDDLCVAYAEIRLSKEAKIFWLNEVTAATLRGDPPITWAVMSRTLRDKYVPKHDMTHLLLRWIDLKQGRRKVREYIKEFEECCMCCDFVKSQEIQIALFVHGLKPELGAKVLELSPTAVDQAYRLVENNEYILDKSSISTLPATKVIAPPVPAARMAPSRGGQRVLGRPLKDRPRCHHPPPPPQPLRRHLRQLLPILRPRPRPPSSVLSVKGLDTRDLSVCPSSTWTTLADRLIHHPTKSLESTSTRASPLTMILAKTTPPPHGLHSDHPSPAAPHLLLVHVSISPAPPTPTPRPTTIAPIPALPRRTPLHAAEPLPASTLPPPTATELLQHTAIFYVYVKIRGQTCKLIVDSGSCINAVSKDTAAQLGLRLVSHSALYNVSWIDASTLPVKSQCLIPLKMSTYEDSVLCDVLLMQISSIILGRPWLFDHDVKLKGRPNSCSFLFRGRRVL